MDELFARVKKTSTTSTRSRARSKAARRATSRSAARPHGGVQGTRVPAELGLPNFFFHHVTAYNLLRHNGVDIGKRDFLGG
jgi:hypothetical protein